MAKSNAVVKPNLGLYYDRPAIAVDPRGLVDGVNFRIKDGQLSNLNLGYSPFLSLHLNGPITFIEPYTYSVGAVKLLIGTNLDIYVLDDDAQTVSFITPRYETGTANATGSDVVGVGTEWLTNAKVGQQMYFGAIGQTNPAATWYTIAAVNSDTSITLSASAGITGAVAYTLRNTFSGNLSNVWDTEMFINASPSSLNEIWLTNGVDNIVRWNGLTDQVEVMSDLGFTCKILTTFKNMMLFLNVVQNGATRQSVMINSNPSEPQNVTTGLANEFQVHGKSDAIIGAKPLGDALAIYSENNVVIAVFTGDDLVFIFRNAISNIGAKAGRAIVDYGNYHEFIGTDSQYRFDGVTVNEINYHLWRNIVRAQDPVRVHEAFALFDDENGDVIWSIPLATDTGAGTKTVQANYAYTEHYIEGKSDTQHPTPFSKRAFPFTASGLYARQTGTKWSDLVQTWSSLTFHWNDQFDFTAFPLLLVGDQNGYVYTINTSQNANGSAVNNNVTFGKRTLGDGRMRGLLTRVYPFMDEYNTDVSISVLMSDHADKAATITDTQTFDQSLVQGGHFTVHYRRGRFFQLKISNNAVSSPWVCSGYDVDIRNGGMR